MGRDGIDARDRVRAEVYRQLVLELEGKYRIEDELGKGGMAVVYRARDLANDRVVALKVLHAEMAARVGAARFSREIKLCAQLQHQYILPIYDSGTTTHGRHWFTMPYVSGKSVRDQIDEVGALPIADAIRIAREAAQALGYAHKRGVVHRDIKPENLLLGDDGVTLVADFGVAKAMGPEASSEDAVQLESNHSLTESGFIPGTPKYMSPEQLLGGTVDHRSDIYSLATTTFEMLTGRLTSQGGGGLDLFLQQMSDPMPRIRVHRPEVSEAVEAAVRKGMHPNPQRRFESMSEFDVVLEAAAAGKTLRLSGGGPEAAAPGIVGRVSAAFKAITRGFAARK